MKVLKNYLYNALYQLFRIIVPFFTIPYLSRTLGPTGIGINSYTNSVIQYFILFGDLGITVYGNRKIAYVRNNRYKLTQTFFEIMIMQICTVTMSYLAFFVFLMFTHQYQSYYLAQSILIIAGAFDISWFFMGVENFKITVLRNFVVRLFILIFIFMFVKSYSDLLLYIILYASSLLIGNLTLFPSLHKYVDFPNIRELRIWRHLKPSFLLMIPTIATQIYLILNKTMLGLIDNVKSAGFYDQSDNVVKIVLSVVTATGTVMLPHVAHAFANGRKKSVVQYLYDSFSFVTALSIGMAFGIAAISSTFVPLFFGNRFMIVVPLMMVESIVIVMIAWSNAIGVQYLLPTKQTKQFTLSVITGAIVNIIINIPMILLLGVMGSIISTVISEFSVTMYQMFAIRNQISFKTLFNNLYKYVIAGFTMFIIVLLMNINLDKSWLMLVVEIMTGVMIYLVLIFILRTRIFSLIKKISMSNY